MKLEVSINVVEQWRWKGLTNRMVLSAESEWPKDRNVEGKSVEIRTEDLTTAERKELQVLLKEEENQKDIRNRRSWNSLRSLEIAMTATAGPIKNLKTLPEMLMVEFRKLKKHWYFVQGAVRMEAYLFTVTEYHPAVVHRERDGGSSTTPAYVSLTGRAIVRGVVHNHNLHWERTDLGTNGSTVQELLSKEGVFLENPMLLEAYEKETAWYDKVKNQVGVQFLAAGTGELKEDNGSHWWDRGRKELTFEFEGKKGKVVMDDDIEKRGKDVPFFKTDMWLEEKERVALRAAKVESEENEEKSELQENTQEEVTVPVHPYVYVFSLRTHQYAKVHTNRLEEYVYDATLGDKLVLPAKNRELIDVLVGSAQQKQEDIVRGKAGGVVIVCSGDPGTGKTLTAEVYSEVTKKTLYVVQCSQLGMDHKSLETELTTVLNRATRWKAILLIDEGDVYIHERGTNMVQNAIVGVFLRVLEYYRGVLFLTTNRATIIDDAVLSRAMAHVKYTVADNDKDRVKLWEILTTQYQTKMEKEEIEKIIKLLPSVSGRAIKQMIRLARALAEKRQVEVTAELIMEVSLFQDNLTAKAEK